jgi:hypothetical protein
MIGTVYSQRQDRALAVGLAIAAAGLFVWAGLRGPIYYAAIIAAVAFLVPWLVWSRPARRTRGALLARSPIVVSRRPEVVASVPQGERGLLDFRMDSERSAADMLTILGEMTKLTARQGKRMERRTRRLVRLQRSGSTETAKLVRQSDKTARDLNEHADDHKHD